MDLRKTSISVGALLAIIGVLGIIILVFDSVLREYAPSHFSALIVFVLVDLCLASLVVTKSSKVTFTLAAVWSVLRIVLLGGDVLQGVSFNYLFNPFNVVDTNPPGIPAAVLDLMLILQIIVILISLRARTFSTSA